MIPPSPDSLQAALAALAEPAPPAAAPDALAAVDLLDVAVVIDTPIGPMWLTHRHGAVTSTTRIDPNESDDESIDRMARFLHRPVRRGPLPAGLARAVDDTLRTGDASQLPVDLRVVTPFQASVLHVVATIAPGDVRPYGWIAEQIGSPQAVRAVGTAVGHNPVPVLVPCHRVVRRDGTLGQYSMGGPTVKRELLAHEGVDVSRFRLAPARPGLE